MSKNTATGLTSEMIVAVSAVIVGVCALGVSLYETSLMREQQRAAVVPMLELSRSFSISRERPDDPNTRLHLQVENVGIGPARVQDFRVYVDGEPQLTWRATMQALLGRQDDIRFGQSTINGRTIPPERLITIFELNSLNHAVEIAGAFSKLEFEACFCSIFDECWTTSYRSLGKVEPVEACVQSESSFQQ
jgi:hypothetical protein